VGTWLSEISRVRSSIARQRGHVELSVRVVADDRHLGAGGARDLQVRHVVGAVLGAAGQDAIAPLEAQAVEHRVPGARGVLQQRDLVGLPADQAGGGAVDGRDPLLLGLARLVAADPLLQPQVLDHGVGHRPRHQRGSGAVEVDPLGAPGGVAPHGRHVDRHQTGTRIRLKASSAAIL